MPTTLRRLRARLYADFLMAPRLDAYRHLLEAALAAEYEVTSVGGFWRLIEEGGPAAERRIMVLRHDIDTDPGTASALWDIDRDLGVAGSWFFRLSTLAPSLMAGIAAGGGEVSYHFEELSTVAKRRGLRRRADAVAHLPEARDRFARNLRRLRASTGLPMRVVAPHGDFVNRRLGISNGVILDDPDFRRHMGIDLDPYDADFLGHLLSRFIDAGPPDYWEPSSPLDQLAAGTPVVSVLVHPRHWRVNRRVNAGDDLRRIAEGLRLELRAGPRRER